MKKNLFLLPFLAILTGCVFFNSKEQFENGRWFGLATTSQVAEIIQYQQNLEATKALTPKSGYAEKDGKKIFLGFEGIVINESDSVQSVTILTLRRQKVTGFLVPRYSRLPGYLPPGEYIRHLEGTNVYQQFQVGTQQYNVEGALYHWYVYLR